MPSCAWRVTGSTSQFTGVAGDSASSDMDPGCPGSQLAQAWDTLNPPPHPGAGPLHSMPDTQAQLLSRCLVAVGHLSLWGSPAFLGPSSGRSRLRWVALSTPPRGPPHDRERLLSWLFYFYRFLWEPRIKGKHQLRCLVTESREAGCVGERIFSASPPASPPPLTQAQNSSVRAQSPWRLVQHFRLIDQETEATQGRGLFQG